MRDNFCNGLYDELFKIKQPDAEPTESRWERESRLLQEEAEAVKKDGEKCSALPPSKRPDLILPDTQMIAFSCSHKPDCAGTQHKKPGAISARFLFFLQSTCQIWENHVICIVNNNMSATEIKRGRSVLIYGFSISQKQENRTFPYYGQQVRSKL